MKAYLNDLITASTAMHVAANTVEAMEANGKAVEDNVFAALGING